VTHPAAALLLLPLLLLLGSGRAVLLLSGWPRLLMTHWRLISNP
jgi:hypothetical protein